ncbi:MAG: hypothetical protein QW540_11135 [Archaeoglobaceae archaeon]
MTGVEEEKKEVVNSTEEIKTDTTEEIQIKQNEQKEEKPQEPSSEKPKRGISTVGLNFKCKKCDYSWKPRKKHVLKPKCPLCGSFRIETVESVEIEKVKPVQKPKTHEIAEVKAIAEEEEKDYVDDEIKELLEEENKPKGLKGWIWVGVAIFVLGLISLFFFQTRKESLGNGVRKASQTPKVVYDIHPPGLR